MYPFNNNYKKRNCHFPLFNQKFSSLSFVYLFNRILRDSCVTGKQGKDGPEEKKDADGELWGNVEAQAAFLGPNLWDKTLPYDADLKVLNHVCTQSRDGKQR